MDPARQWLADHGAGFVRPDPLPDQAIGGGETAVLTWALAHSGYEAIVDDRAARKCAGVYGILFRGTLGVVLAARQRHLLPAAKPVCDDLVRAGLLIDTDLLCQALHFVGE